MKPWFPSGNTGPQRGKLSPDYRGENCKRKTEKNYFTQLNNHKTLRINLRCLRPSEVLAFLPYGKKFCSNFIIIANGTNEFHKVQNFQDFKRETYKLFYRLQKKKKNGKKLNPRKFNAIPRARVA